MKRIECLDNETDKDSDMILFALGYDPEQEIGKTFSIIAKEISDGTFIPTGMSSGASNEYYRNTNGLKVTDYTTGDGLTTLKMEVGVPEGWSYEFERQPVTKYFIRTSNTKKGDRHLLSGPDDLDNVGTVLKIEWLYPKAWVRQYTSVFITYKRSDGTIKEYDDSTRFGLIAFDRLPELGEDLTLFKKGGNSEYLNPRGWQMLTDFN